MIEIVAKSGFSLNPLVESWGFMDSVRSDIRVGICDLLKQLLKSKSVPLLDPNEFAAVCRQDRAVTALAIDHGVTPTKVVGMAMLFIHQKFSANTGIVEDVVVDENYRGQKIGEKLMKRLIEIARQLHLKSIGLSSGNQPERAAAHKLYLKLGFTARDSTLFVKKLL